MSGSQITYDYETTLAAPDGGVLKAIFISIEVEPKDSGCFIYGWQADGNMGYVEIRGSSARIDLPFARPQIFVKYLAGLKKLSISTLGWKDSVGA